MFIAVGFLAGCSSATSGDGTSVVDQGYQSGDGSTKMWAPGDRGVPVELSGTDFAGVPVDVAAWRGDVVVLNTWYAACPPCRKEAPDLVALAADYADQGVHLLGINGTDAAGAAQAYERKFAVTYPSIADSNGAAIAALQGAVPVQAVPTTVVVDREGRVAGRILGLADPSTLSALVDDVLAEPAATGAAS
ncbi:TlpA family protein disulfide reductase [Pengzhenrongella phosphoraccumulans]|uniref:TlpA family protein disulfide reductase n=1 Tax=Pengzhenrongella phosphoraccumulans TaxID=3114394 RepID=UPI00388CF60C